MKPPITLIIISTFLFFRCAKHQYIYFNTTPDSGQESLTYVNDTLEIAYNFNGNDCPVNITIFNKSEEPIYVDWKKSVAIIDEEKVDYYVPASFFAGDIEPFGDFDGEIITDDRISFIPPHTCYSSTRAYMCRYYEDLPQPKIIEAPWSHGRTDVKLYQFEPDISPLKFKSLVTLSSNESFEQEVRFTSEFYIAEIIESHYSSIEITSELMKRPQPHDWTGARSITSVNTDFTAAAAWMILIPSVILLAAEADENE